MKSKSRILILVVLMFLLVGCSVPLTEVERDDESASGYQAVSKESLDDESASGYQVMSKESLDVEPVIPPEQESLHPESWPAHFAAIVKVLGNNSEFPVTGLCLMDITLDGVPELLVQITPAAGWAPGLMALSRDFPMEKAEELTIDDAAFSGFPLRFFQNDDTGDIIFSSLIISDGAVGIAYHFFDELTPYRQLWCTGGSSHRLLEMNGATWGESSLIEEIIVNTDLDGPIYHGCGIEYGRNSSDPTIVHLVNLALEGFTEIPAPPIYTFDGFLGWKDETQEWISIADREMEVREWIFEVAESWKPK